MQSSIAISLLCRAGQSAFLWAVRWNPSMADSCESHTTFMGSTWKLWKALCGGFSVPTQHGSHWSLCSPAVLALMDPTSSSFLQTKLGVTQQILHHCSPVSGHRSSFHAILLPRHTDLCTETGLQVHRYGLGSCLYVSSGSSLCLHQFLEEVFLGSPVKWDSHCNSDTGGALKLITSPICLSLLSYTKCLWLVPVSMVQPIPWNALAQVRKNETSLGQRSCAACSVNWDLQSLFTLILS